VEERGKENNNMKEIKIIHEFEKMDVFEAISGDFYIETEKGDVILIISPSGSDEHQIFIDWLKAPERTEHDFEEFLNS
jgi:ABC-type histidine transport system ATPase subunit